jgi:predicted DNA-binding protein with PD1-like motif
MAAALCLQGVFLMQFTEGSIGRIFALRLEHGERMPDALETFAAEHGVHSGFALMVGGVDDASRIVVGPEDGTVLPPVPMVLALAGVHEVAAVGLIFPDEHGRPMLHMHAAFGRGDGARSGCIRAGIVTWRVLEVILLEVTGLSAARLPDEATGFTLLQCSEPAA